MYKKKNSKENNKTTRRKRKIKLQLLLPVTEIL